MAQGTGASLGTVVLSLWAQLQLQVQLLNQLFAAFQAGCKQGCFVAEGVPE